MDFIRFSISEESICLFIEKLNCIEGIQLRMSATIEELKHQDYKGKRIHIEISDDAIYIPTMLLTYDIMHVGISDF